jgi:ankyrin repeat protein
MGGEMTKQTIGLAVLMALFCAIPARGQDIHAAASEGDLAAVSALLSEHPDQVNAVNEDGATPLHLAAARGHAEVVRFLLGNGSDISAADGRGFTVLQAAVRGGHEEVVELLIAEGADVDAKNENYGLSAVDFAFQAECRSGGVRMTGLLVSKGAEFDANGAVRGPVLRLDMAVICGNLEMVRFLIERGADVNAETGYPLTPLASAAAGGKADIMRFLLESGADVNALGTYGVPATWFAVSKGQAEMVEMLLAGGAGTDFTDEIYGRNLLQLAALNGYLDIVTLLLSYGAPVNDLDNSGSTALQYAARYGHERVADLLIEHGATVDVGLIENYDRSPGLTRELKQGEAVAWYLKNRGWAIRTQNHMLVFDAEEFAITRPAEPSLTNGFLTPADIGTQDVIALYTAYHGEIGEPAYIHEIEDSLTSITYVHNQGDRWRGSDRTVYMSPGEEGAVDDMEISTVAVTEEMTSLGYLVEVDSLVIYYAGFRAEDLDKYKQEIDRLAGRTARVDLAFLPLIEAEEDESDFKYFLEALEPDAVFVLDPNRREHLFPGMAERVKAWGYDAKVFAAQNPGDMFIYPER